MCFTVRPESTDAPVRLYARRFHVGKVSPARRAIVLVHGAGPTHRYWDAAPDFSVARNLARAGYLVIAYDRLGYGRSPYAGPGGGWAIDGSAARAMLHEVVTAVRNGSYAGAVDGRCPGGGPTVGVPAADVILMGDSVGGAIVSGYPGTYADVVATVQDGWSNLGFSPGFTAYAGVTLAPQLATGSDYARIVPDEASCRLTTLYEPGVAPSLRGSYCRNGYGPAPVGDGTGLARLAAENLAAIASVGPGIPVLLVFGDRDFVFPRDKALAEYAYWAGACDCDVELYWARNAGHALAAHVAMPAYTAKVASWLKAKGLGPRKR